jgi:hypothetical protein
VDTLNEGETGLNCLSFSFSLGIQGKQRGWASAFEFFWK